MIGYVASVMRVLNDQVRPDQKIGRDAVEVTSGFLGQCETMRRGLMNNRVYAQLALAACHRWVWTFTKPQIVRKIEV